MIKGRFKGFLPAILWSFVIIILSILPGKTMNSFSFSDLWNIDKLGHLLVYGIHTILLLQGFRQLNKEILIGHCISALLLSVLLGFSIEIIQDSFFPDRHFDILDLIANIIGSIVGLIIYNFLKTMRYD